MSQGSSLRSFLTNRVSDQRPRYLAGFAVISAICLGLSQLGSYLVNTRIPLGTSVEISSFLHFTHIRNMVACLAWHRAGAGYLPCSACC